MYDDEHNETPAEQEVELEVPSPAEAEDQSYDAVVERAVENMNRIHGEDESSAQEAEPVVEATEVVEPEAAEPAVTNDAAAVEPDSATDDFVYETGKEPNEEDLAGLDVINENDEDDENAEDTQEAKNEAPEIIVEDVEWVEVPPHNNKVEEENALVLAENAARGAHRSIMDGFTAFKTVREATQRHIDAREALQGMQDQLDEHMAQLKHRIDIEEAYPQIVSEQTATIEEAKTASQQALKRAETLDGERTGLESDLESMKVRHEDELRPYRNVAAATKSRADDATLVLDEAKRATKNAEQALSDATRWRDERISSVNRSVDRKSTRLNSSHPL
ncbi:MAG: hypothetical protein IKG11_08500, partial [Atopobiaceae bacterium]|nr:hypothetical protein [Atopobiaceae bacterium]